MIPRVDRLQCICGKPLQGLATDFYHCAACGRSKWADDSISGGWIGLIIVTTIILIVVLGYVGSSGQQFR